MNEKVRNLLLNTETATLLRQTKDVVKASDVYEHQHAEEFASAAISANGNAVTIFPSPDTVRVGIVKQNGLFYEVKLDEVEIRFTADSKETAVKALNALFFEAMLAGPESKQLFTDFYNTNQ